MLSLVKGHELSHLQNMYYHRGNTTAEDRKGEESDVSLFLVLLVPALQPAASPAQFPFASSSLDFLLPARHPLHYMCDRGTFVWWHLFFQDGDLYSQLDLHKLLSYGILQMKCGG